MSGQRPKDIPISECSIGQLVVRLGNYRRMCEGYQAKIDLILLEKRGGNPTKQILVHLRNKKDRLERDMKIIRKRLTKLRGETNERSVN